MHDQPKSLAAPETREARLRDISLPHVRPLTSYVLKLRQRMGTDYAIPYFDPMDGGVDAECLFLLEAPGPRAVASGFISRNNPDETAKNFLELNAEVGLDRRRTLIWNICPWYVGTGKKIRAVKRTDILEADEALSDLLKMLRCLRIIALVGKKAASAGSRIRVLCPGVEVVEMPHPSPVFINRLPQNRAVLLRALGRVAQALADSRSLQTVRK